MASSTDKGLSKMKKPIIVSPAGNREKLKFAVRYGADNVFFGGDFYNLRIQSQNFSFEDMKWAVDFCRENKVESTFLLNSFLHQNDLKDAAEYIDKIKDMGFHSIMVSDPGMLMLLKEAGVDCHFHLSTQMNTLNDRSVKFWLDAGFSRIVLGRETTIEEVKMIKRNTDAEIEIFAHGALCIAYSGRCLLSRYLSGRDANQGDCSQPCRWGYSLVEEKRPGDHMDVIEYKSGTEILSSKDLCLLERLEEYIDAGVDAFKIEGRIKSLYHAANSTRIYKHALETAGTPQFRNNMDFWKKELDLVSHRPYTSDLFNEFDKLGFGGVPYINRALFVGYKIDDGKERDEILFKTFNPVRVGETLSAIFPIENGIIRDGDFKVLKIYYDDVIETDMARPRQLCRMVFDKPVADNAIFRRINE